MNENAARQRVSVIVDLLLDAADVIDVWTSGDREAVRFVHRELADALDELATADDR